MPAVNLKMNLLMFGKIILPVLPNWKVEASAMIFCFFDHANATLVCLALCPVCFRSFHQVEWNLNMLQVILNMGIPFLKRADPRS